MFHPVFYFVYSMPIALNMLVMMLEIMFVAYTPSLSCLLCLSVLPILNLKIYLLVIIASKKETISLQETNLLVPKYFMVVSRQMHVVCGVYCM